MKKALSLILALAMILALTACGSKTDAPSGNGDTQTDPSAEKIVLKIGHVEAEDRSTHKALLIFKDGASKSRSSPMLSWAATKSCANPSQWVPFRWLCPPLPF